MVACLSTFATDGFAVLFLLTAVFLAYILVLTILDEIRETRRDRNA